MLCGRIEVFVLPFIWRKFAIHRFTAVVDGATVTAIEKRTRRWSESATRRWPKRCGWLSLPTTAACPATRRPGRRPHHRICSRCAQGCHQDQFWPYRVDRPAVGTQFGICDTQRRCNCNECLELFPNIGPYTTRLELGVSTEGDRAGVIGGMGQTRVRGIEIGQ